MTSPVPHATRLPQMPGPSGLLGRRWCGLVLYFNIRVRNRFKGQVLGRIL